MKYDRSLIMKRAHELRRGGLTMSLAMKMAWAEAKSVHVPMKVQGQEVGVIAAFKRYGVDLDWLAHRARDFVLSMIAKQRPIALEYRGAIEAKRGDDGSYSF